MKTGLMSPYSSTLVMFLCGNVVELSMVLSIPTCLITGCIAIFHVHLIKALTVIPSFSVSSSSLSPNIASSGETGKTSFDIKRAR